MERDRDGEPDHARREVVVFIGSLAAGMLGNARDGIYEGGGSQLLLSLAPEGSGYGATFDVALQF